MLKPLSPDINALLPPSDFKDLLLAIQHYLSTYSALLASPPSDKERDEQLAVLLRQSQEIDASYGWVLASDIGMVARTFSGDETAARGWMREVVSRVEVIREALKRETRRETQGSSTSLP
jgi:hypothetical protein